MFSNWRSCISRIQTEKRLDNRIIALFDPIHDPHYFKNKKEEKVKNAGKPDLEKNNN